MKLKRTPDLLAFLAASISEGDPDTDFETANAYATAATAERRNAVLAQAKALLADAGELPVDEFGSEANRWFAGADEARAWLGRLVEGLEAGIVERPSVASAPTKDSNGAVLAEGDSVTVIKDLKVKGGSSDLKRGTLVKKIHLVGDPEVVECRVDGSTLVLKTCFLRKA